MFDTTLSCVNVALFCAANSIMWVQSRFVKISPNSPPLWIALMSPDTTYPVVILTMLAMPGIELMNGAEFNVFMLSIFVIIGLFHWHCCKVSDEAAFCLIQRPYISKTLLTRRISPRGSP